MPDHFKSYLGRARIGPLSFDDVRLGTEIDRDTGMLSWGGDIRYSVIDKPVFVQPGEYDIELADGRTGRVLVSNVEIKGGGSCEIELAGTGPFPEQA